MIHEHGGNPGLGCQPASPACSRGRGGRAPPSRTASPAPRRPRRPPPWPRPTSPGQVAIRAGSSLTRSGGKTILLLPAAFPYLLLRLFKFLAEEKGPVHLRPPLRPGSFRPIRRLGFTWYAYDTIIVPYPTVASVVHQRTVDGATMTRVNKLAAAALIAGATGAAAKNVWGSDSESTG